MNMGIRDNRPPHGLSLHHPALWIATFGGAGLLPRAPGTWGSLAALPVAWIVATYLGSLWLLAAALTATLAGLWAAGHYVRKTDSKDPAPIVIDEVAGQLLTLAAVPPHLAWYLVGFALFRLFDILKPWPVSWADRALPGAPGIMLDDILAGLYAFGALILFQSLVERL